LIIGLFGDFFSLVSVGETAGSSCSPENHKTSEVNPSDTKLDSFQFSLGAMVLYVNDDFLKNKLDKLDKQIRWYVIWEIYSGILLILFLLPILTGRLTELD